MRLNFFILLIKNGWSLPCSLYRQKLQHQGNCSCENHSLGYMITPGLNQVNCYYIVVSHYNFIHMWKFLNWTLARIYSCREMLLFSSLYSVTILNSEIVIFFQNFVSSHWKEMLRNGSWLTCLFSFWWVSRKSCVNTCIMVITSEAPSVSSSAFLSIEMLDNDRSDN